MDIRSQVSVMFHLDKCIGCHTCSIACKNVWSDRRGTEYMWWNNVETKPGTGYPTLWEDQEEYRGGWELKGSKLRLKLQGRLGALLRIFFNPHLPTLEDYYEPWTYKYDDLFTAPAGDDQPTARPISMITGKPIDIVSGPNWDDDLAGSEVYASNDINLQELTEEERNQLKELERLVFFYLPRICNHCLNPACVAACPSGAIYKRGEDGIVLVNQDNCRAWRMCISSCPYKKAYYNWNTGKSEKCILCYPRIETGQPPACMHACVGRIRYLGVLLYDADEIETIAKTPEENLVDAIRSTIKDPFDPEVIEAAKQSGLSEGVIESAQQSPVYRFVKEWQIALPLHPEFRTLPMLFYVPPLLPVIGKTNDNKYDVMGADSKGLAPMMTALEHARIPLRFMASLFSAKNEQIVGDVYKKLIAVRLHVRSLTTNDVPDKDVRYALSKANLKRSDAEDIWHLTSKPTTADRFVIPPLNREVSVEQTEDVLEKKGKTGIGYHKVPERRW